MPRSSFKFAWPHRRDLPCVAGFMVGILAAVVLVASGWWDAEVFVRYRWPVLFGLGILVAVAGLILLPRWVVPELPALTVEEWEQLGSKDRAELANVRLQRQHELRNTILQALAGLVVLAGSLVAWQQLAEDRRQATATQELTRQGQASERFTRAIDQLGSARVETRIGGIYGLEQIAQQAPDMRLAVVEVLVAYVHRRAPLRIPRPPIRSDDTMALRVPDVQAALTVLGRRQVLPTDPPLDLQRLDLRGAELSDAALPGALLSETDLSGAQLHFADLRKAVLSDADLSHAQMSSADLSNALLSDVDLSDAGMFGIDLSGAYVHGADLRNAFLLQANLNSESLDHAILTGAFADKATRWPDRFDWETAGVSVVREQPERHPG